MSFRSLVVLLLISVFGCAKALKYDKASELGRIEEYDKLVQVKEIETPSPTPSPELSGPSSASQAAASPSPTPSRKPVPKEKGSKTKSESQKKKGTRLPEIEDGEGFEGRRPLVDPFRVGESVTLMMTYFGVSAGDMTLQVLPFKEVNGRKAYHFKVILKSSPLFSMVYSVDDWADSLFDYEEMKPYTFSVHAIESKKLLEVRTFFDWSREKAQRWERLVTKEEGAKERKKEWDIPNYAQNVFSAVYYLRTFALRVGKTYKFVVADDGRNYVVSGEVLRKEKLRTDAGPLDTLVIKPTVYLDNIFQPMGTVLVWVTDDDQKMMVRMEAEVKIGKIVAQLRTMNRGQ